MSSKYKEPTNQDIIEYLKEEAANGKGFDTPEELEAAVHKQLQPFDMSQVSEEERDILEGKNTVAEEDPPPPPDTPVPDEFNLPSTSDDLDFTMDFKELGSVEVPEEERDLYLKALLNDVPFRAKIQVFPGFEVEVQSRTVYFDDLIYDIVRNISTKGEILGLESGFTKLMRLLAGVQVVKINGQHVEFEAPQGKPRQEVAAALQQHVKEVFDKYQTTKWNALVKAICIFDAKVKICNDRLLDRSFWEGADTN